MSKWSEWKKNLGDSRPWHLLDAERLVEDENIVNQRFEICKACPELIPVTHQCKKCGCFMVLKTKISGSECPLGKWNRVDI